MRIVLPCLAAAAMLAGPHSAAHQRDAGAAEPVRLLRGVVRGTDPFAPPLRRARVATLDGRAVFADAEGRFEMSVSRPATLRVSKPGFAPRLVRTGTSPAEDIEIQLARGAIIVGDVIDEAGAPAAGIDVRVRRIDADDPDRIPIDTVTTSDDGGRFRVGSLPGGDYEVTAARAAATVRVRAGEDAGVALLYDARADHVRAAADAAEEYEAARRHLIRGASSIEGRVIDAFGQPVAGARLRLEPARVAPAGAVARAAASNSQGQFQILNVAAGAYRLRAAKSGLVSAEHGQSRSSPRGTVITVGDAHTLTGVDVTMFPAGVVTGMVVDKEGEPIEGLAMHAWQVVSRAGRQMAEPALEVVVRRTDDRGQYRLFGLQPGTYYVVATEDPAASSRAARTVADAPRSYYPGVGMLYEARTVRVDVALDASGVDMTFRADPTYRVTGDARTSTGRPLNRPVLLAARPRPGLVTMPPLVASMQGPAFVFQHVVPGPYVLQGIDVVDGPSGPEAQESGMVQVTIPSTDIELAPFRTWTGSTISGRATVEGGFLPPLTGQWIEVMPDDPAFTPFTTPLPWTVRAGSDGTFEIGGLQGRLRFVGTDAIPPGWWLKAVQIDGRNATDLAATFGGRGDRRAASALLSTAGAEIWGRALDARKDPVATYVAVAFAVDRRQWYPGSRSLRAALPEEDGRFRLGGLPPADYFVVALDRFDSGALEDSTVLQRLVPLARRVSISAGQTLTIDFPLTAYAR